MVEILAIWPQMSCLASLSLLIFFLFTDASVVYGSSWARGRIRAATAAYTTTMQYWIRVTYATYAAACGNTGSLTHWVRPGIKPTSSQRQCQVLNSLSHNRNSIIQFLRAQHPCFSRTFFVSSYPGFPKRLSHELFLWVFSQPCMVQIFMGIFCFLIQGFHF